MTLLSGREDVQFSSTIFFQARSSPVFALVVVALAGWVDTLLYGLVVPFLPILLRERATLTDVEVQLWSSILVAVYGATVFISSPIFGYVADKTASRKGPLITGLFSLAMSLLIFQLGTSVVHFVISRALTGIAAAAVYSVGFAMLYDRFGPDGIGSALGWVSVAWTAGSFFGPMVGGVLYDFGGEIAVYTFAYGFILADVLLRLAVIEPEHDDDQTRPVGAYDDLTRPLLGHHRRAVSTDSDPTWTEGSGPVGYESIVTRRSSKMPSFGFEHPAISELSDDSDPETQRLSGEQSGSGSIPSTGSGSSGSTNGWVMFRLLSLPGLVVALCGWLVTGALMSAFDSILPLFVQDTFYWTVSSSGLVFVPLFIPSMVLSPLAGSLTDRKPASSRFLVAGGFLLLCVPGMALMSRISSFSSIEDKIKSGGLGWSLGEILLCLLLVVVGSGIALVSPVLSKEVAVVVEKEERANPGVFGPRGATALAYGLHSSAFALGCLSGPILGGVVKAEVGWAAMCWVLCGLCACTGCLELLFLGGWIRASNTVVES